MAERYDQQDGSPDPRPDIDTGATEAGDDRSAIVGERSTQEKMAGQGTGQNKEDDEVRRQAGRELARVEE